MNPLPYPTIRWSQETPGAAAVIDRSGVISYAELETRIVAGALLLQELGVHAGDRVIICAANSVEWIIAAHAITRIGAVLVPITVRLNSANAASHRESLKPALILIDVERFSFWFQNRGGRRLVFTLEEFAEHARRFTGSNETIKNTIEPETLHSIVFTSGTAGVPKGVCLSFRNHLANAFASAVNLGVLPEDRWLLNLPLYHVGGLAIILRAALYGTAVVLADSTDGAATAQFISEYRITQLSLVATTLWRLVRSGVRHFPDHLRSILVGGGPVPIRILDEAVGSHLPVLPTYGMTETASQAATAAPCDVQLRRSVARPLCLTEISIRGDGGRELPAGSEGRICVRGPMVGMGYWQGSDRIAPLIDQDGWFATSDVGSLDDGGRLSVAGRIDHVIISGGEKIHPEELEAMLIQSPKVSNAAVIPEDDPVWGQRPVAYVELEPGGLLVVADVSDWLASSFPRYKLPVRVVIVPQLPLLPSGKIDRQALSSSAFLTQTRPQSP
jgi:O-succinylbenzoic acid--CoA ligase